MSVSSPHAARPPVIDRGGFGSIDRLSTDAAAMLVIGFALLLRLYGAAMLGLGVDESYAIAVSRVPSLSFYDHPPLGFMLARWMADLTGSEAAFVVRLPYLALFTASSGLLYWLTRSLFSRQAGLWALGWFSFAPFFIGAAGSWVVPDGPLTFFVLLVACALRPLIFDDAPSHPWLRWIAVGAAFGFATLSKYQAFLIGLGALVLLLTDERGKRWLAHPAPYVAALIALVLFTPVIVWNAEHQWGSFAFQTGRAAIVKDHVLTAGATNVLRLMLGQAIYLLPAPFIIGLWLLWEPSVSALRSGSNGSARLWGCRSSF